MSPCFVGCDQEAGRSCGSSEIPSSRPKCESLDAILLLYVCLEVLQPPQFTLSISLVYLRTRLQNLDSVTGGSRRLQCTTMLEAQPGCKPQRLRLQVGECPSKETSVQHYSPQSQCHYYAPLLLPLRLILRPLAD